MGRYINPFTDWGFKRLFGQEFSKDLLISFLNDLLEGEQHIKDLTFKDKEQLPETKDLRGCIFDIYCETDDGKYFIVEMQNRWVPYFINRSVYYASKAIVAQRQKLLNDDSPSLYRLLLIYLSLPFFNKESEECNSGFDKWIYVLKHMEVLERMPFTAQKTIFKRLAELADTRCMSKEEQEKYDESRKAADDYYSGLYGSFLSGMEEGEAKGETKGRAKEKRAIALSLLAQNVSAEIIAQATGLSIEEINKL